MLSIYPGKTKHSTTGMGNFNLEYIWGTSDHIREKKEESSNTSPSVQLRDELSFLGLG